MISFSALYLHDVKSIKVNQTKENGPASYSRTIFILLNPERGRGEHELQLTLFAEKIKDLEFVKEA